MDSIGGSEWVQRRSKSTAIGITLPTIQLSLYLRMMLLLFTMMTVICVGWVGLVRWDISAPNPFSAYTTIFPGQTLHKVIEQGFTCTQSNPAEHHNYCTLSPVNGPFWYIHLVTAEDIVNSVTFCAREGALTIGDLALLWGKPNIQLFQRSGLFKWSSIQTSADGLSPSWAFSYYFPVAHVTFAMNKVERGNPVVGHN